MHRSDRCSSASSTICCLPVSPSRNRPHNRLGPGHLHTRLRYTIRGVVPVPVSPLSSHSLLTLPLEAKLILVTISPTIPTMELYGLWLRLRLGLGLPTRLLTLLLSFLTSLWAHKLHRFLKIICWVREYGWIWSSVKFVSEMVRLGLKLVLVSVWWWDRNLSNSLNSLTTVLSKLVSPKCLTIIAFESRYHDTKLRLLTRQPAHTFSQLIILILQAINIMCKLQILNRMQFTSRARSGNRLFQLSLKRNSVSMHLINLSMQNRARSAST